MRWGEREVYSLEITLVIAVTWNASGLCREGQVLQLFLVCRSDPMLAVGKMRTRTFIPSFLLGYPNFIEITVAMIIFLNDLKA